jgi:hypothetical protein
MKRKASLVLKREVVGELSTEELAHVRAGTDTTPLIAQLLNKTAPSGDVQCHTCCSCTAVSDTIER